MKNFLQDDNGTALMEFVLVMPIFFFMIFCTIQLSLVCIAKQMVHYAAYSAARAAIVYNPDDYCFEDGTFRMSGGPVHRAACTALAWMGQLPTAGDADSQPLQIPGWGPVPGSGFIINMPQVAIDDQNSCFLQDIPAVKVTVQFEYPLKIPFAGPLIAYFRFGGKADGKWTSSGLIPSDIEDVLAHHPATKGTHFFLMRETCVMPLPWDNRMFPSAEKTPFLGTENH